MTSSLHDALLDSIAALNTRAVDLLNSWDEDRSGTISKSEFRKAMKALGFMDVPRADLDAVFDLLDTEHNGSLKYKEMTKLLRDSAKRAPQPRTASLRRRARVR